MKTTEFVINSGKELADDLVIPTTLDMVDSRQDARTLVASALKELGAAEGDDSRQARIHLSLGMIIEHRLCDSRRALTHYLEAHELSPTNLAALRLVRRVFWSRQNWTKVLELLDEELELTSSPAESARLHLQKGRIFEEWLANTDQAIAALGEALKHDPGNRQVLHRLRRIHWRREDADALLDVCRQAAATTQDRRYRGLLFGEMARLYEEELDDEDRAIETYAAAFAEDPTNTMVSTAIKRLYRRHFRWGDLVDVLLTEAELAQGEREQVLTYLTAARLCRSPMSQQDRALELLSKAYELLPNDPMILQEMADLLLETGRFKDLADIHRQRVACLVDEWERVTAHYELGQVLEERLGEEDEALFHYRKAVAIDPTYVPALQAMGKLCQRRGELNELVAISAMEAEVIQDPQTRAGRLCGLAELCENQLGDNQQAIEFHRRALANLPHYTPSMHALERLYTQEEDWGALVDLLETTIDQHEGPRRGRLLDRLGRVCEEKLDDPGRTIAFLERALRDLPDELSLLHTLQRLQIEARRWPQVIELLDQEIEYTTDDQLATALMHKAAELSEARLNDQEQAVDRYREGLSRVPDHGPTLRSLGRIYFRQGKWREVLALYQTEVDHGEVQPGRRSSLLYKMGEIFLERLEDEAAAMEAFNQALIATPRFLPALQALARMHRKQEDWPMLIEALERQAEVLTDPERKAATLQNIGELFETQMGQHDRAIQHYQLAMGHFPGHEPSRGALLRILIAGKRWREVAEVYEEAIAGAVDDGDKVATLRCLGEVWDHRLLDPQRAVECYEQALTLGDDNLETLEALAKLHRRTRNHERLVEVYEKLALCTTDPAEAIAYLYEAATIMEVHLPDHDRTSVFERIRQTDKMELSAVEALCRDYLERSDGESLLQAYDAHKDLVEDVDSKGALLLQLAGFREATGDLSGAAWALSEAAALVDDWLVEREHRRLQQRLGHREGVAESLVREASLCRDDQLAVKSLMKAAAIYQQSFQDRSREIDVLTAALEREPFQEEAAARLEQLLVQQEAWGELVDVLRRRLDVIADDGKTYPGNTVEAQIELLARMAWIQREHLGQPLEAVSTLTRSLQFDANHLATLLTLGELHLGLEQWKEAVDIYSRIIAVSNDPDTLCTAHVRLGDVWDERLGDHRHAISSYQNVLALSGSDTMALGKLFELFRKERDWENAADTMSRLIEAESDTRRLVSHHVALASIMEKGFNDPHAAVTQLQQAQTIDAANEEVLAEIMRLHSQLGDWTELADAIRSYLVALPHDQESRGTMYRLQLGEILRRRLGRITEALEQYRAVIEIDPTNIEARMATASILVGEGRLDEAIVEHREIQEIDLLNLNSLSQLRSIYARRGDKEMAYAQAAVVVCLGQATDTDESYYRERRARGVRYPRQGADAGVFESVVVHPGEDHAGGQILSLLGDVSHRIRPPRLADWQVGKTDRLPFRSDDPLRILVREVRTVLGLERDVEIYVSPVRSREMDLLLTDPPALVVGAGVMSGYSSMEVRFWLGQLLSYIRNRTWIAYGFTGKDLRLLIHAACRMADPKRMFSTEREVDLAEMARLIHRSLNRRGRRALEEICEEFLSDREPRYEDWIRAMQHTSLHAGLWVVNDLETALGYLGRMVPALDRERSGDRYFENIRDNALATALIQFWISEEYDSLKQAARDG